MNNKGADQPSHHAERLIHPKQTDNLLKAESVFTIKQRNKSTFIAIKRQYFSYQCTFDISKI